MHVGMSRSAVVTINRSKHFYRASPWTRATKLPIISPKYRLLTKHQIANEPENYISNPAWEMSVSAWDHFLGTDWERYAKVATKATCIGCAGIGVMTIMFNYGFLVGMWILGAAVFLAILEFPGVFSFVPSVESYREFMMESLLLKLDEVKAIACFSFSLFCFMSRSITILAGLALMATSVLLAFSAVNRRVDAADQSAAAGHNTSSHHSGGFVNLNTPLSGLNNNNMASKQNQYQPVQSNDMYINPHTGLPSQKQGVVIGSYQNA